MRCFLNLLVPAMAVTLNFACVAAVAQTPAYRLGRTPTAEEIRKWDIAVGPEGKELPPGSGTAKQGAEIYGKKCVSCHGPTLEGSLLGPRLVGGKGTLASLKPVKTIGSYWPFATTIWDFINRGMPPKQEGSLSPDDVYALTAFILYKNDILQESDVLDAQSLPKVPMPNRSGFYPSPWPKWKPQEKRQFGMYP